MKKLLALSSLVLLTSCSLIGNSKGESNSQGSVNSDESTSSSEVLKTKIVDQVEVPDFAGEAGVTFTGYAIPRWNDTWIDAVYQKLAEAEINKVIPLFDGRDSGTYGTVKLRYDKYVADPSNTNRSSLLSAIDDNQAAVKVGNLKGIKKANQYGLKYLCMNELLYDYFNLFKNATLDQYTMMTKRMIDDIDYDNEPGYAGTFICDEPREEEQFEKLAAAAKYYKKKNKGGIAFVNLLARIQSSALPFNYDLFKQYVGWFFDKVYPYVDYASFDVYPLTPSGIKVWQLADYEIFNEYLANANHKGILKSYIDCPSKDTWYNTKGIASTDYLRFQIYSGLVYGTSEFQYYECSYEGDGDGIDNTNYIFNYKDPSIISHVYNKVKEVNHEVHSFDNVYRHFNYKKTIKKGSINTFNYLKNTVDSYGVLKSVSEKSNNPTLVGCFTDGSQDAFMVMNYQDPTGTVKNSEITLNFDSSVTKVLVYQGTTEHVYSVTDGAAKININGVSGAFVIPLV